MNHAYALGGIGHELFDRSKACLIGALLVSIALILNEFKLSSIPSWLTNATQLAIGVSLIVRFTPQFVHTAPRWLASVTITANRKLQEVVRVRLSRCGDE